MKSKKFYHSDDVITFPILEGKAIHNLIDDTFYELNSETAEEIWDYLDGILTIEEITQKLAQKYDVDSGQLIKDIEEFIIYLLENNLIKEV